MDLDDQAVEENMVTVEYQSAGTTRILCCAAALDRTCGKLGATEIADVAVPTDLLVVPLASLEGSDETMPK